MMTLSTPSKICATIAICILTICLTVYAVTATIAGHHERAIERICECVKAMKVDVKIETVIGKDE